MWRPRWPALLHSQALSQKHSASRRAATSRKVAPRARQHQWQAVRLGNAEARQVIQLVMSAPAGGGAPGLASAGASPTELPPSSSSPTKPLCGNKMPSSTGTTEPGGPSYCSAVLPCFLGAKIMMDTALTSEDSAAGGPGSAAGVGTAIPAAAWTCTASLCFRLRCPSWCSTCRRQIVADCSRHASGSF